MKIIELVLTGYKRFVLSQFKRVVYRPNHKMQLLLGTNGSGKSSLMHELSPLPATASDFHAGGHKIITISKGDDIYVLKSNFAGSAKHSFLLNGVELNPGGTMPVQKELVKAHFDVTNDVHEVMTGLVTFSSMSVSQRREWFTRLSNINFNYAIGIYLHLKNKLREVDNVLKFQNNTLLVESNKLLDANAVTRTKTEITEYTEMIDQLFKLIQQCSVSDSAELSLPRNDELLTREVSKYRDIVKQLTYSEHINSITNLDNYIEELELHLAVISDRYLNTGKETEDKQNLVAAIEKVSTDELHNLKDEFNKGLSTIDSLTSKLVILRPNVDPTDYSNAINLAYDSLHDTLEQLVPNPDRHISKDLYATYEQKHKDLTSEIQRLKVEAAKYTAILKHYDHLKQHDQVTCPKCQSVFIAGYTPEKEAKVKELITEHTKTIDKLVTELSTIDKTMADISKYFDLYRNYNRVKAQFIILEPIWDNVTERDLIFLNPKAILQTINNSRYDIPILTEIKNLKAHLDDIRKLVQLSTDNQQLDLKRLESELKLLNERYFELGKDMRDTRVLLDKNRKLLVILKQYQSLQHNLEQLLATRSKIYVNEVNRLRSVCYNETLKKLQLELMDKQNMLNVATIQSEIVKRHQAQITELEAQKDILTYMVSELSPKDGLIARSLSQFIDNFVKKINRIIAQIWSYPFELLPINNSDELDLDYKFNVVVNAGSGVNTVIPDITKCSSGMREVIDLAFKIVSMHYLGLEHAPIYLDEFGKSMDVIHRVKAFETITQLLAHSNYSQIFVVSHYEQGYGSIKNADMIVLNSDNVAIPVNHVYNQVVQLEH